MTMNITEEEIITCLVQAYDRNKPPYSPYPPGILNGATQRAAVLIPMLNDGSGWQILYIRRTENKNDRHGGQVAFPGGRCDPNDPDPEGCALREAHEEVGILPTDVRILGRLNDLMTITNYQVAPIVGAIPWPYKLKIQIEEVSRAFTIPLTWLADPKNREVKKRYLPEGGESISVTYFQPYDSEVLWGASARITLFFLRALRLT
ncbi:MAG: CoA pyrophosphatase [Anaerolineales bacterium]|jgi:8-oxo-dGTP pyrophosphatase MutT (NUDIX family)